MTIRGRAARPERARADIARPALGAAPGTRHDANVSVLLVILLAGLVWVAFSAPSAPLREPSSAPPGASSRPRRALRMGPIGLLGAVLLGLICLRFGVNWLVVLGGMLLALARSIVPLLRLWPFLQSVGMGQRARASDARPGSNAPQGRAPRMTRQEALQIFGLDAGASQEDVQREYRRLMKKLHPDLGGSSYLAAKVNEARDALL
jgi:hypothetical protein